MHETNSVQTEKEWKISVARVNNFWKEQRRNW